MKLVKRNKIRNSCIFFALSILLCSPLEHLTSDVMAAKSLVRDSEGNYVPRSRSLLSDFGNSISNGASNVYNAVRGFVFGTENKAVAVDDENKAEEAENKGYTETKIIEQPQDEVTIEENPKKVGEFSMSSAKKEQEEEKLEKVEESSVIAPKVHEVHASTPRIIEYNETSGNSDYSYAGGEISFGYDFVKSNSIPLIAEFSVNFATLNGQTESTNQDIDKTEFQTIGSVYLLPTTISKNKRQIKSQKILPYLNAGIGLKHAIQKSKTSTQQNYNTGVGTLGAGVFIPLQNNVQLEIGYRMVKDIAMSSSKYTVIDSDNLMRYENPHILHTAKLGLMLYL